MIKAQPINDYTIEVINSNNSWYSKEYELLIPWISVDDINNLFAAQEQEWHFYWGDEIEEYIYNLQKDTYSENQYVYNEDTIILTNLRDNLIPEVYNFYIRNYDIKAISRIYKAINLMWFDSLEQEDILKLKRWFSKEFQYMLCQDFNTEQLIVICEAYINNMDIEKIKLFAYPQLNEMQMFQIRYAFIKWLSIEQISEYAKPNIHYESMYEVFHKLYK